MKKILGLFIVVVVGTWTYAQTPKRDAPPALTKAKNLQLPPVQKFTLSNGLQVVFMEKHNVPLVQINLLVQTGSFDDPAGKEGLSSFAMDLMDEGAGKFNSLQLADEIEFLGAQINTANRTFTSEVNCSVAVSKLDAALKLMTDIVLTPSFAESEIERIRKSRLNALLQGYDDPNVISQRAFSKLLFPGMSYGKFPTESSIRSFTKDDLVSFHKTQFVTGNCTLVIVGDATRDSLTPVLEKYLASLPKGIASKPTRPVPTQVKGLSVYIIDKPAAAQSIIRIGRIGASRTDAAYSSIVVMNTILGGSFTSRLNNNLRELHGYAYGASSGFSFWMVPGPFIANSSVQTDVTGPALGEFFNEFKKMRQPMPEEDFIRGRNYVALGYAGQFETNSNIASALADLVTYNLPDQYFNSYVEKVLTVSKKELEETSKRFIVPDNMLVVVVGDRAKIEAGIAKLNLGKVTVMSIEDVLGKKPQL